MPGQNLQAMVLLGFSENPPFFVNFALDETRRKRWNDKKDAMLRLRHAEGRSPSPTAGQQPLGRRRGMAPSRAELAAG